MKKTLLFGISIIIIILIILYFAGCFESLKQLPQKDVAKAGTNLPAPIVIPCPDGLKNNDTLHVEIITAKKIHKKKSKKSAVTKKENNISPPPKIEAPPPPIIKERKDSLIVVTKIIFDPDSSLQKFVDGLGKLPKTLGFKNKVKKNDCDTCKITFIDY